MSASGGGVFIAGLAKILLHDKARDFIMICSPAATGAIALFWNPISEHLVGFVRTFFTDMLEDREKRRTYTNSRKTLQRQKAEATSKKQERELEHAIAELDRLFQVNVVDRAKQRLTR